jgi:membrane associated rhomboid family serine protease
MFLHADFLHLFMNMLYLWIFGDNVESRFGPLGYLFAYLGAGAIATLSYAYLNPDSTVPLVGASGAISAVLGFYLIWFPRNLIRVLVWFVFFIQMVYIRAVWVLAVYVIYDNILMPLLIEPMLHGPGRGGGVAYGAHLAGFAAGVAAAYLIDLLRGRRPALRPVTRPGPQPITWRGPLRPREDPGERFQRAMREGRMEEAADAFSRLSQEGGVTPLPAQVFRLGRWLYERYLVPDAAAVFRFYIRNFPNGDDLDRVHLGLGVLLVRQMGQPSAGREHLLTVLDLTGDDAVAETARSELKRLDPDQASM